MQAERIADQCIPAGEDEEQIDLWVRVWGMEANLLGVAAKVSLLDC